MRLILAAAILLLAACVSYRPGQIARTPPPEVSQPGVFDYVAETVPYTNHDLIDAADDFYQVKQISIPSTGDSGQADNRINALYYQSRNAGPKPLVVILPIWGSYTYPPDVIAAGLRKRSRGETNVLLIQGDDFLINWYEVAAASSRDDFDRLIGQMGSRFHTGVIDTRRYLDWAAARTEIDEQRMALVGFSMGALVGSLVAASDKRLAASVLVMGGADFPAIMSYCQGRPGIARESIMTNFDWSADRYRQELSSRIGFLDPRPFSAGVDPSKVFIIDAKYDNCMPPDSRDALWRAMNEPERLTFLAGHKTAFLYITPIGANYMRGRIYRFLEDKLESDAS